MDIKTQLKIHQDKIGVVFNEINWKEISKDIEILPGLCEEFLNDEQKAQILLTKQGFDLPARIKYNILMSISDEELKERLLKNSNVVSGMVGVQKSDVIGTMSVAARKEAILSNKYNLTNDRLNWLASTLPIDDFFDFYKENNESLKANGIRPYKVIMQYGEKKEKLDFVSKMEAANFTVGDKRLVFLVLDARTKRSINTSDLDSEYKTALQMKFSLAKEWREKFKIDLSSDLELYRGLDEVIYIDPTRVPKKHKERLMELIDICPNTNILDSNGYISMGEEYKRGEEWVEQVLSVIKPEWKDVEKVAFIDSAIGKKISYSPDYGTEVYNENNANALWKIIHSGYGVCGGIAELERNILHRIGINSEVVFNEDCKIYDGHAFLKIKDIHVQTADGTEVEGDTILDPTWNLSAHRYGAMPENFCRSYNEIRRADVNKGVDYQSHKNDGKLSGVTLDLDTATLRQIYANMGIVDGLGEFPIKKLLMEIKKVNDGSIPVDCVMKKQLQLLENYCPEFAVCQNETIKILGAIMKAQKDKLEFQKCVVDKVYKRGDNDRRAELYMYIDFGSIGKKFYIAERGRRCFSEISQETFELKFECYDLQMEKLKGKRPWEIDDDIDEPYESARGQSMITKEEECII